MFSWFKKVLPDGWIEDESQELSPRAAPPITAEEAFKKWIKAAPKQPAKSQKLDNV